MIPLIQAILGIAQIGLLIVLLILLLRLK